MKHRQVTCPATGKLEYVDVEQTPLGVLVTSCSRLCPRSPVTCGGGCAVDMDRCDRDGVEDRVERVLVMIPLSDGPTRAVAQFFARCLESDGMFVEVVESDAHREPPPADYDAIVIGTRVRFGRHSRPVMEYVAWNRASLQDAGASCFAVGKKSQVEGSIERLVRETGWLPAARLELEVDDQAFDEEQVRQFAELVADGVPPPLIQPSMSP